MDRSEPSPSRGVCPPIVSPQQYPPVVPSGGRRADNGYPLYGPAPPLLAEECGVCACGRPRAATDATTCWRRHLTVVRLRPDCVCEIDTIHATAAEWTASEESHDPTWTVTPDRAGVPTTGPTDVGDLVMAMRCASWAG